MYPSCPPTLAVSCRSAFRGGRQKLSEDAFLLGNSRIQWCPFCLYALTVLDFLNMEASCRSRFPNTKIDFLCFLSLPFSSLPSSYWTSSQPSFPSVFETRFHTIAQTSFTLLRISCPRLLSTKIIDLSHHAQVVFFLCWLKCLLDQTS